MKPLHLIAVILAFGGAFLGSYYVHSLWEKNHPSQAGGGVVTTPPPAPRPPAPPPSLRPLPDADTLAARMKPYGDIYTKVRDDALAEYAKNHPTPQPYDDEAKASLRLASYLFVWGDVYGEGLWPQLDAHADKLKNEGNADPIWSTLGDIDIFMSSYSTNELSASGVNKEMIELAATGYPPLFKFMGYKSAIKNLMVGKSNNQPPLTNALTALPDLEKGAVDQFQQIISQHVPTNFIYSKGSDLLDVVQDDEPTLKDVAGKIKGAFDAADPDNPIKPVLDAEFYTDWAWCARGNGYANTVTDEGWKLFRDRLAQANTILNDAYTKYPNESRICNVMMTVVLGQQGDRQQMEDWFSRGIKADPDDFTIYMSKRWYLYPRWYGSDEDLWNFGSECAKSDNWGAKIPMIFIESIADTADRNPDFFGPANVWDPVEKVYRGYLERYPDSVHYRSKFAKSAVQGGHWDVAKGQFKILGDQWDRDVFSDDEYATMSQQANAAGK